MNIFEYHLSEIRKIILSEKESLELQDIENLKGVNLEIPPEQFNFDLSCNIAMVLGKKNMINPKTLALKLKDIFLAKINNFSEIDIAGPGFLNIKLSKSALLNNIKTKLKNKTIRSLTYIHTTTNFENTENAFLSHPSPQKIIISRTLFGAEPNFVAPKR